jgi:hypothetical protein
MTSDPINFSMSFDLEAPRPKAANPLQAFFDAHRGRLMAKWDHYFDIYHRHFARFRGTPCTVVEIGIYHGGSLQMWRDYFGPQARIIGVDIEPRAAALAEPGTEVLIGDQADPEFLGKLAAHAGPIDVLIDDGGHRMDQQINTFRYLFGSIKPTGVYLCEDVHTSYWAEYGGGYRARGSYIEFTKMLIDQLNAIHSEEPDKFVPDAFTATTDSLTFYDSIVVIEKRPRTPPEMVKAGVAFFPDEEERPSLKGSAGD